MRRIVSRVASLGWGLLLIAGGVRAQGPQPLNPACANLLPATDVAKVSGDAAVTLIAPGAVPMAGGACNYATDGQTVILYIELDLTASGRTFQRYKTMRAYQGQQVAISGVGDEAFSCHSMHQDVVVARKGSTLVALLAPLDINPQSARLGKPHLTRDQLIALAKQMVARS